MCPWQPSTSFTLGRYPGNHLNHVGPPSFYPPNTINNSPLSPMVILRLLHALCNFDWLMEHLAAPKIIREVANYYCQLVARLQ